MNRLIIRFIKFFADTSHRDVKENLDAFQLLRGAEKNIHEHPPLPRPCPRQEVEELDEIRAVVLQKRNG